MKSILTALPIFFSYMMGMAQPTLVFTPVSLTGPALVQPLDITGCGDGSGRLFVVEKRGTIRIIENGEVRSDFFLEIQSQVINSGERGLLGMAFHPLFPDSPYIYVNYVINGTITNQISRFTLNPENPNDIDETTELKLLSQTGVQTNHKAGALAFGPDGYLYIGMGDGGGGNDPSNAGQNNQTLLGKMLRIDVNQTSATLNYSIPPDNPFVGVAGLDEIWANGMRNPWRISFDRLTGDFWIADVGQNAWEEVDMVPSGTPGGMNFGWDCREGNHNLEPQNCPGGTVFTWPIFEYPHNCNPCPNGFGASITGGYVYRGSKYPVLQGYYVCADYVSNYLWMIRESETEPFAFEVLVQNGGGMISGLVTFGEDDDGELYASNLLGTLYAVTATGNLPVQWEGITALIETKGNHLEWQVNHTDGIISFDIQRSFFTDVESFTPIARVEPVPDQINYAFTDPFIQPRAVYYRVAAYLEGGSTIYSPVVKIQADPVSTPVLILDQDNHQWRIQLPEAWRNGKMTLYDIQGKEVYSRSVTSQPDMDLTPPIVPGFYVVKVKGKMGVWSEEVVW